MTKFLTEKNLTILTTFLLVCCEIRQLFTLIVSSYKFLQLIAAAFSMGFDSFISTALNFAADEIHEIEKSVNLGNNEIARIFQRRITDLIYFITSKSN